MFNHLDGISKVMIVDFDAHQGNGHERDFLSDDRVYIMDMYNRWIYPNDRQAKGKLCTVFLLHVHVYAACMYMYMYSVPTCVPTCVCCMHVQCVDL